VVAVVVGASVGGVRVVQALRRLKYPERIVLIGAESEQPYDRPPLSKTVLSGQTTPAQLALLRDADRADPAVEIRLGVAATGIDVSSRLVQLANGEQVAFDDLVIATGSSARRAPWGVDLPVLRTLTDAQRLATQLRPSAHLVVVGGGFIGAEVASTAAALGLTVTVVDPLEIPIARVVGAEVGALLAGLHGTNGVRTEFGTGISGVERIGAGYGAGFDVQLTDGRALAAEAVLVGIGARPNDTWVAASGLPVADGIVCDSYCRVLDQTGVYAAGDVARWTHPRHGEQLRIEHWTNAVEQADCVAYNIVHPDQPREYAPVEYVWTDQYRSKIQITGRPATGQPVLLGPESGSSRYAALYGDEQGRLVGAVTVDWPRATMEARAVVTAGGTVGSAHDRLTALSTVGAALR
jgi:phthalate 3,4-dioxygenase ferredoxin reductase subunit